MKGKHHIVVQNNRLHYDFYVKRNITIIRGDSATGKTTLINLIESAANLGDSSGVEVVCDKPCVVLQGYMWKTFIENGTYLHYNKSGLNRVYLQEKERQAILSTMPEQMIIR